MHYREFVSNGVIHSSQHSMLWKKCHLYLVRCIFDLKNATVCFVTCSVDVNEDKIRSVSGKRTNRHITKILEAYFFKYDVKVKLQA